MTEKVSRGRSMTKRLTHFSNSFSFSKSKDLEPDKHADELFYVPKEILPCLDRVSTKDYTEYIEDKKEYPNCYVRFANQIIELNVFNSFMCLVILLNMAVLIIETDHIASQGDALQDDILWTGVVGWIVLVIFICELGIRLIAFRTHFWRDMSNIFDFLIVSLDAFLSILSLIAGGTFPLSILRVFRLAKFARVSKVLLVFPELRLLLAGLIGAMSAIFWGTILLGFSLVVWSMVAVLFIHPLNKQIEYEDCERCGRAYSSVAHATLTFWQSIVTGDSWGRETVPLIEKHPSTMVFFVGAYLTVGMAVTNLILGVVVSVAQEARRNLMLEDSTKNTLVTMKNKTHLFELCKDMDLDKNGLLSKEELVGGFKKPGKFRDAILALDVGQEDLDLVWAIVDPDNKGQVSYKELVSQLASLRSSDSQFMLCYIKYYITQLRHKLIGKMKELHAETLKHELNVEAELQSVKEKEIAILEEERRIGRMALTYDRGPNNIEPIQDEIHGASPIDPTLAVSHSDHIASQKNEISTIRQTARTNDSHAASSARQCARSEIVDEQVHTWVQRVCDDISKVRDELADILRVELEQISTDMNAKLDLHFFQVASISQQTMNRLQPETPVLYSSRPAVNPACCSSPVSCIIGQPQQKHVNGIEKEIISPGRSQRTPMCSARHRPEEGG